MTHTADPPAPSADAGVLDGNVFDDLLQSLLQPPVVAALYRKFVANAAAFIGELRDQDPAARLDTLHTLKGSAAMMGAKRMAEVAMRWQAQGQCSPVQVEQAVRELETELVRFRVAVASRLHELGSPLGDPE